jgi:hypothetical protein
MKIDFASEREKQADEPQVHSQQPPFLAMGIPLIMDISRVAALNRYLLNHNHAYSVARFVQSVIGDKRFEASGCSRAIRTRFSRSGEQ